MEFYQPTFNNISKLFNLFWTYNPLKSQDVPVSPSQFGWTSTSIVEMALSFFIPLITFDSPTQPVSNRVLPF